MIVRIADLNIDIQHQYDFITEYCKDYLKVDAEAMDIKFRITEDDMKAEQGFESVANGTYPYLESIAALRKIGEQLPLHDRLLLHGASISFADQGAFLFTAPSGTGKSTHIRLWREYLGDKVTVVNGDKPMIKIEEDSVTIYGTPWAGKEGWQNNCSAGLKGICFVERGKENSISRLAPLDCLNKIFSQVYMPGNGEAAGKTLELIEKLLMSVPAYLLKCDISEEAVKTSFEMLTGLDYEKEKK